MSLRRYYRLLSDPSAASRWHLGSPIDLLGNQVDPRTFTRGTPVVEHAVLQVPVRRPGDEVGFNFCDFDMVVTPARVNAKLEGLVGTAVQRIPVRVNSTEGLEILNICDVVCCVDETRSQFTRWCDADGRPDKIGQFRMIVKLRIDSAAAAGHHIFRVEGWPIALIVSERVKELFESEHLTGLVYERVD
jgi:hypothetical protein